MTFLGIDGGGSKTTFLLEDHTGRPLARLETGPSNWISAGAETARESISKGALDLPFSPDVVCGGFAGAGRPEGVEFYKTCLKDLFPDALIIVETDASIAYAGAIGAKPGVLLLAGTGSIAIARRTNGTLVRAGGWGAAFSDEGGGFWIGREAVRSALRANDAGAFPEFVAEVTQALGLPHITDAPTAWKDGRLSVRNVASLASRVIAQFPAEPVNRILTEAANHLRQLAEVARQRAELPENCVHCASGSIGSHAAMQKLIGLPLTPPAHPPVGGAILLARDRISAS